MVFLFIFLSLIFLSADLPLGFPAACDQSRRLQCSTKNTQRNRRLGNWSCSRGGRRPSLSQVPLFEFFVEGVTKVCVSG